MLGQGLNLIGKFDFSFGPARLDIEAMVARYAVPDCWRRVLEEEEPEATVA
jgi:hypothetical protein